MKAPTSPPVDIAPVLAELERRKAATIAECDQAIKLLTSLWGNGPTPAPRTDTGWKHRRRCSKCKQLTPSDPCAHCGAEIAPPGARK